MKSLLILIVTMFSVSGFSQVVINLGPFKIAFQDPIAHSQEKRATSVDKKILVQKSLINGQIQIVNNYVSNYEKSLRVINPSLKISQMQTKDFLNHCIDLIVANNSVSGSIPGLSKVARTKALIASSQVWKISGLKDELNNLFLTTNYMREGERKVIQLQIIERALRITLGLE